MHPISSYALFGMVLATDPACARLGRLQLWHQETQCLHSPQLRDKVVHSSRLEQNGGFIVSLSKSWANVFVTFVRVVRKHLRKQCVHCSERYGRLLSAQFQTRFLAPWLWAWDEGHSQQPEKVEGEAFCLTDDKKESKGNDCRCTYHFKAMFPVTCFLQLGPAS